LTVRTRLTIGLTALVGALLGLGALSAWQLWRMSALTQRIIADNYDSVVAAQQMKESLERQDSAGLFALLGRSDLAARQLREHRARFDDAYRRAAANVTEGGEAAIIDEIGTARDSYYRAADHWVLEIGSTGALATGRPRQLTDEYFRAQEPLFSNLRGQCDRLLSVNQDAMRRKAAQAAMRGRQWQWTTLVTALALVLGGVTCAIVLSNGIVRPVRELTDATNRMAAGDLEARVDITSSDELGTLGARFNDMARRIRELRHSDLGKVFVAQQTAEAAMNSLYDPVIVTDANGRIQRINAAAEPLFGPEAAIVNRPIAEVVRDPRLAMPVLDLLESGGPADPEESAAFVPLLVDGIERTFRQRTTQMRAADGTPVGAVMLLEDITHLREIDRLKSEFIAGASHELRTPLTSLEMGVHLLLEGSTGELSPKQLEILTMCRDDALRLDTLVRELLDLSRLESGRGAPQLEVVRVADLLHGATEPLRRQAVVAGLTLSVRVPPELPDVLADPSQVERVLANLVTNAVRATAPGGRIDIAASPRESSVAFAVSDTGRGIPPDYLPRVFEPFVQVPNAPSGGSGLGLSISRRIVEAHRGQMTVRSEPGVGTTFTFTLPVAAGATSAGSGELCA